MGLMDSWHEPLRSKAEDEGDLYIRINKLPEEGYKRSLLEMVFKGRNKDINKPHLWSDVSILRMIDAELILLNEVGFLVETGTTDKDTFRIFKK